MRGTGTPFEHWPYRLVGDVGVNAASMTLLNRLMARGQLRRARAWLQRQDLPPRVRQTLYMDFEGPVRLAGQAGRYHALWLVEESDGKLFAYGVERPSASVCIGGRVLRAFSALDSAGDWIADVATQMAARLLPSRAAAIVTPDRPSERWVLAQVEQALLQAAFGAFSSALDPEVLELVRTQGRGDLEHYNHFCGLTANSGRHRLQAAKTYPWFAADLRTQWQLRRVADAGQPLAPALASHFQVKPRTIAKTQSLSPPKQAEQRRALLERLDALPAEYLPRDEADWGVFQRLGEPLGVLAEALGQEAAQLLKPFRSGWEAGLQTLSRQASGPLEVDAIFEMMQAAYLYGVRPALLDWKQSGGLGARLIPGSAPASFYPLWFGRYGLGRLLEMARRWRLSQTRFSLERLGADVSKNEPIAWPSLLATPYSRGDYRILELTSQADLEMEGHRLSHCVGTYVGPCLVAGAFLYSVRNRLGESLSTFEVIMGETGPTLIQHKARLNAAPPPVEQTLVAAFVSQVLAKVPLARIADTLMQRQEIADRASALIEALDALEEDGELDGNPSESLAAELSTLCAFLHPAEARREGIATFLAQAGEDLLRALPTALV